jgi:hypothetical protein
VAGQCHLDECPVVGVGQRQLDWRGSDALSVGFDLPQDLVGLGRRDREAAVKDTACGARPFPAQLCQHNRHSIPHRGKEPGAMA